MKHLAALFALALLAACQNMPTVRISRTLSDGTVISTDGQTLTVANGKDSIALELPRK
jgi:hypothetical protein